MSYDVLPSTHAWERGCILADSRADLVWAPTILQLTWAYRSRFHTINSVEIGRLARSWQSTSFTILAYYATPILRWTSRLHSTPPLVSLLFLVPSDLAMLSLVLLGGGPRASTVGH